MSVNIPKATLCRQSDVDEAIDTSSETHPFISDCEGSAECARCGEYVTNDIHAQPHRLSYEEAIKGIPLCEDHDHEC